MAISCTDIKGLMRIEEKIEWRGRERERPENQAEDLGIGIET